MSDARDFAERHAGKMAESGGVKGRIVGHYNGSVIIEDVTCTLMDIPACVLFGAVVVDPRHGALSPVDLVRLVDDAPKPAQVTGLDAVKAFYARQGGREAVKEQARAALAKVKDSNPIVINVPLAGLEDAAAPLVMAMERMCKAMSTAAPCLSRESPTTQRWFAEELRVGMKAIADAKKGGK